MILWMILASSDITSVVAADFGWMPWGKLFLLGWVGFLTEVLEFSLGRVFVTSSISSASSSSSSSLGVFIRAFHGAT